MRTLLLQNYCLYTSNNSLNYRWRCTQRSLQNEVQVIHNSCLPKRGSLSIHYSSNMCICLFVPLLIMLIDFGWCGVNRENAWTCKNFRNRRVASQNNFVVVVGCLTKSRFVVVWISETAVGFPLLTHASFWFYFRIRQESINKYAALAVYYYHHFNSFVQFITWFQLGIFLMKGWAESCLIRISKV